MMIGEAWGDQENLLRKPFVGPSGEELERMCEHAGFAKSDCYLTNVFNFQPLDNNLDHLCVPHKELPKPYPIKRPLKSAKWLEPKYLNELDRLHSEIESVNPNVIVALGATPVWALLPTTGIFKNRGVVAQTNQLIHQKILNRFYKVVPTFHPAFILRSWQYRVVAVADLIKAKNESNSQEIKYTEREIFIAESIDDLAEIDRGLADCDLISFDIETSGGQIQCISFSPSSTVSYVVPFWDRRKPDWSYWTFEEEVYVRTWMKRLLESPKAKLAQNGLFDIQYCMDEGMYVQNLLHDTMLIHHAMFPELPKGLGFMGSVYTNAPAWKTMTKTEDLKRED